MIPRALCRLGLHVWSYPFHPYGRPPGPLFRLCLRCSKEEPISDAYDVSRP